MATATVLEAVAERLPGSSPGSPTTTTDDVTWRSKWYDIGGYVGCTIVLRSGRRRTILQHREVMEKSLGRQLGPDDVVHHINGIKNDNRIINLKLTTWKLHWTEHIDERPVEEIFIGICSECGDTFSKRARNVRGNLKKGFKGPFCGRSCAGKASHK